MPGFEYRYKICVKTFIGFCTEEEWRKDVYDLSDPVMRKKLKDMGFVLKVRERI